MPSEVRYVEGLQLRTVEAQGRELDLVVANYGEFRDVGPFFEQHMPTVFEETLSRHANTIKLVVGHDDTVPAVATPVEWRQMPDHLGVTYRFGSHEQARAAATMAEEGMFGGCSVAFLPGKKPGDSVWEKRNGAAYVTRNRARLLHVGLVVTPADADAAILAVRSMGVPDEIGTPRLDEVRRRLEAARAARIELPR
jgi:HK97 family phage prohead protease